MHGEKLKKIAKAVNNQQAEQSSRNLMLHILFLYELYYYLKREILYNISITYSTHVPAWG